jgi:hypothetical protein
VLLSSSELGVYSSSPESDGILSPHANEGSQFLWSVNPGSTVDMVVVIVIVQL